MKLLIDTRSTVNLAAVNRVVCFSYIWNSFPCNVHPLPRKKNPVQCGTGSLRLCFSCLRHHWAKHLPLGTLTKTSANGGLLPLSRVQNRCIMFMVLCASSGVPYTLAQMNHLLLYHLFLMQPMDRVDNCCLCFLYNQLWRSVLISNRYFWEVATIVCKLWEPLPMNIVILSWCEHPNWACTVNIVVRSGVGYIHVLIISHFRGMDQGERVCLIEFKYPSMLNCHLWLAKHIAYEANLRSGTNYEVHDYVCWVCV